MDNVCEEKIYTLGFSMIPSIGPIRFEIIKANFPTLKDAWEASEQKLSVCGLGPKVAKTVATFREKISPREEFAKISQTDINFITTADKEYSTLLKEISSPPFVLFYLGNLQLLEKTSIAMVGTRVPTHYGKNIAIKFASELANCGIIVVSGMAKGIDSLSHKACTDNKKPTIAVLGCGIAESRKNLSNQKQINSILATGGLVISEYPPNTKGAKHTFPARNRIISGLSLGTLVIEAGQRSGTLITANYALDQNREVFAVPGNIFSDKSLGTHCLLKKGAALTTSVNDIFEALNFATTSTQEKSPSPSFTDEIEAKVYNLLTIEPLHIDKLAKKSKLAHSILLSKLSFLELQGVAQNIGGSMFIRK